jgi:phosphatidylserine decarboxylase
MRFAPEGFPFIIGAAGIAVAVLLIGSPLAAFLPLVLTLFMLYFFRDPERTVPEGRNLFIAPADGKVIVTRDVRESRYLNRDVKQVSIFMSPFDVHVNRIPCDGKVKSVQHTKGAFLAAYRDEASLRNENIEIVLETRYGDILVRQVAGLLARRAVCRKKEGDIVQRGERYGIIKFSSRVDIYLPKETKIMVRLDGRVRAGETVLGEM